MNTDTIFREIDSLISVGEAMQRDLADSTFDTLKTVGDQVPYFPLERIQNWVEGKGASLFQFARAVNRKAEKFSESYSELIKPASCGSYKPVGIDTHEI